MAAGFSGRRRRRSPLSERTPRELALAWRDALHARDAPAFGALFAEDGVMIDVEHRTADLAEPRPLVGREEIEEQAAAWLESTPEFGYDVLEVLADETRAAVLWRYEVEGIELDGVSWLSCERGEIREARVYFDSHGLLRALGRTG